MDKYTATEEAYKHGYEKGYEDGKESVLKRIKVRPTAKLYWKPDRPGVWILTCSACDSHLGCKEDSNYCPECGAKFKKPKAEQPLELEETDG